MNRLQCTRGSAVWFLSVLSRMYRSVSYSLWLKLWLRDTRKKRNIPQLRVALRLSEMYLDCKIGFQGVTVGNIAKHQNRTCARNHIRPILLNVLPTKLIINYTTTGTVDSTDCSHWHMLKQYVFSASCINHNSQSWVTAELKKQVFTKENQHYLFNPTYLPVLF